MRFVLVAAFCLISTADALAVEPYEGSWAEQTAACSGQSDSKITISGKRYRMHEGECQITKSGNSQGSYALFLTCIGEGEKWTDAVVLVPQGNRMLVGGTSGRPLVRCRD